ncbi:hypothetical protein [Cupriavidus gilardii]|uniref:hypothetical protein n=1 Tax=Cupriavidus gilardii TaxID=82541 RepID=UPI0021B43D04|nr:hypothetical protein [Cupriavidus gilardii]UXC38295.1 hypothetical protein N4G38_24860 [Cupriavidus gilardii]
MTFHDYYLRAVNEAAAADALASAGLLVDGEPAHGVALSVIGAIYGGGRYGAEGEVLAEPVAIPGWHINLRLERELTAAETAALAGLLIYPPATPIRVWA